MSFIQGEGRTQGTLFPFTLDELIAEDHVCRVIDAFVDRLDRARLGFERAEPAETGRPGYDPRDLLKLYLYGYKLVWVEGQSFEGWGCSECAWVCKPSGPPMGKSLDEMKRNFQVQLSEEFEYHLCANRPRVKGAKLFPS